MNSSLLEHILTFGTVIFSIGVAGYSVISIIKTRNKSYNEFLENRKKRKLNEKN